MKKDNLILPKEIKAGDTVGIFTPSYPANQKFRKKYEHGLMQLQSSGFHVVEGELTKKVATQGYRSGTPKERASEFMELIKNSKVDFLMATIGGNNSSSMIPYLDFDMIRKNPKVISGYSDVTSLHMAILTQSVVSTFYGPAVVPSFGEWPSVLPETLESFQAATKFHENPIRDIVPFKRWSNHFRNALTDDWMKEERKFEKGTGWKVLGEGYSRAPLVVANLNTLTSIAGTPFFPEFNGEILLLEEMDAPLSLEERRLRHLQLMGVFDKISGLIVGKPEKLDQMDAPFSYEDLILEILGEKKYPIISDFDCSHTHPMISIGQMVEVELEVKNGEVKLKFLENMVEKK